MIARLLFVATVPAVISLALTPMVIRLAHAVGAIDLPNERKIHTQPLPRFGGVVLFFSFFLSLAIFLNMRSFPSLFVLSGSPRVVSFILGLLLVFGTGIWDDIHALSPGRKFLIQMAAATVVYIGGFRISEITGPGGGQLGLGILGYPVTVLWIVGITNAFNLIDGLDGLASGIALIASLTIVSTSLLTNESATAFVILAFAGAILGFLPYNFNPASIFLGDSGSLLVGFVLSVLSTQSSTKGSTAFAIIVPLLALGLPIMDTLLAMLRRILHSFLPESTESGGLLSKLRSMFLPDRRHVHHQLIALGFSHRKVVAVLYFVSIMFGAGAFAITVSNNLDASLILLAVGFAALTGIRQLRYKEMAILRNGMLLPLYEWPVLHRTVFQGFLDFGLSALAFTISYSLTVEGITGHRLLSFLPIVCITQVALFHVGGLYRETFRYFGIGDFVRMIKSAVLSVVGAGILLAVLPESRGLFPLRTFVIDFYVLITLVAGARASFQILTFLFRREEQSGRGIIIYGAGANGVMTLQSILLDDNRDLHPLGFLDDDPELEGKNINGYRIFGGHWKLARLLSKNSVEEIIIASESLKPESLHRIRQIAELHDVKVKRSKLLLEDLPVEVQTAKPRALPETEQVLSLPSVPAETRLQ